MLAAPTSIAAVPSPRSRASWNPAVPPPPVGGGAVGNGLVEGLPVADRDADGLIDGLAEGPVIERGVLTPAVPRDEAVGVAEALLAGEEVGRAAEGDDDVGSATEGEEVGSAAEDEDVVQAAIATEASMVSMPQPTAVSLATSPVPTVMVRTFMNLLMRPAGGGPVARSRIRNRRRNGKRVAEPAAAARTEGRSRKARRVIKVKPMDGADM
jgi:hypothetical protein